MGSLNREERRSLRRIQHHLRQTLIEAEVVVEQIGTVDVYVHPSNTDPFLNCVTPHKGVAWVRRHDLSTAFTGLERLGRVPRLIFQDALFPDAFQQQLNMMGLTLESERVIMLYRPTYGPVLPDEIPRGRLPDEPPAPVSAALATSRADLGTWLRVFRAGYFNTETLTVEPDAVEPLVTAVEDGSMLFVLAHYENTPLGAACVVLRPPTAELETIVTAPHWHGMGLEIALATVAVREAMARACDTVFIIGPPQDFQRIYRALGFESSTRVLSYWLAEEYAGVTDPDNTAAMSPGGKIITS